MASRKRIRAHLEARNGDAYANTPITLRQVGTAIATVAKAWSGPDPLTSSDITSSLVTDNNGDCTWWMDIPDNEVPGEIDLYCVPPAAGVAPFTRTLDVLPSGEDIAYDVTGSTGGKNAGAAKGLIEDNGDGTFSAWMMETGVLALQTLPDLTSKNADAAYVLNALMDLVGQGAIVYYQTLTALTPIIVPGPSRTLMGVGPDWKGTTPQLKIIAGSAFSPAGDGADGVGSQLLRVSGTASGMSLINVALDANNVADLALKTSTGGESLTAINSSFSRGKYYGLSTNAGDGTFTGCFAKGGTNPSKGGWRHNTASDQEWIGGRISGANNTAATNAQALWFVGGDGHVISGVHITNSNGTGNSYFGCQASIVSNIYFDNQGDVDAMGMIIVNGEANAFGNLRVKGGNGLGKQGWVFEVRGFNTNINNVMVIVQNTQATNPFDSFIKTTSSGSVKIVVSNINGYNFNNSNNTSVYNLTDEQDCFFNSGSTGAFPVIGSGVVINGRRIDGRVRTITVTGNVLATDTLLLADASAGNITLTMDISGMPIGRTLVIKKKNTANTVTINFTNGTVETLATEALTTRWSYFAYMFEHGQGYHVGQG